MLFQTNLIFVYQGRRDKGRGLCYSTFKIQLYWIIFPTPGPHRTHFSNGCDAPSSIVFCHSIYFMEAELAASASFKNIDCRPKLANEACFLTEGAVVVC